MISSSTQARIPELAAAFQRRDPFRHVVIDDFLDRSAADRLLAEFPDFDTKRALNEMGEIGNKAVVEQIRALGPSYAALDDLIQTPAFLALMSQITGIPDLLYDPHYFGGGTHENREGQDLDAHVDFNRHPVTHTHRRLNLIVYLNHEWQDAWGPARAAETPRHAHPAPVPRRAKHPSPTRKPATPGWVDQGQPRLSRAGVPASVGPWRLSKCFH